MKVDELKRGDIFYDVSHKDIQKYEYFDRFPSKYNYNYSILIDRMTEQPIRIYNNTLQAILDKNITTYEQAKLVMIEKLQDTIKLYQES